MIIRGVDRRSVFYGDYQAADEVRREFKRCKTSIDRESYIYTALDFASYLAERKCLWSFQENIKNTKRLYLACNDKITKEDIINCEINRAASYWELEKLYTVKRTLDALVKTFWYEYPGVALTLENEAVRHFGEIDEHREEAAILPRVRFEVLSRDEGIPIEM